jgi:glycogen debranching enzyme
VLERRARDGFRTGFLAGGRCADVVGDPSLRPNQLLAVSLPHAPLAERSVVESCAPLLTPLGLRSLTPSDPAYIARHRGGPAERDRAYHQGTVWPWLMGPFVDAWVRVRGNTRAARRDARARFVDPLLSCVQLSAFGHLAEIADAEAPFAPKGCPFQAWSLGELLRLDRVVLVEPTRATRVGKVARL